MTLQSLMICGRNLRWCVPAISLVSVAPGFFLAFISIKVATFLLPAKVFTQLDSMLYDSYQKFVLFFFETYSGADIVISGDNPNKKENVLLICNHQSNVDWIVANIIAARFGCIGRVKYILKDELKFLPLYGFYFRQHGCLYLKRQKRWDKNKFMRQLDSYKQTKTPLWLVVFPEGTRFTLKRKEVLEKSQQYAKEHELPVLSQVLTPRTLATEVSLDRLGQYFDAVYDATIAYTTEGNTGHGKREPAPTMAEFFSNLKKKVHIHLERYDKKDIPQNAEERRKWIHDLFCKKERKFDVMTKTGQLPGPIWSGPLPIMYTLPYVLLYGAGFYFVMSNSTARNCYMGFTVISIVATPFISYFTV